MDDIFSKPSSSYGLKDFKLERMVLSPHQWRSCSIPLDLAWHKVRFDQSSLGHVPDNARGVYTFIINPGIANHPGCGYLMYVGKTEKQAFRHRFSQYCTEKAKGEKSRRPHITEMLLKWDGFLWFYYAEITDTTKIKQIEDALLAAYLPPSNHTFPCKIRRAVKKVFAH